MNVTVDRGGRIERLIDGRQLVVFGVGQGRPPQIVGGSMHEHEVLQTLLRGKPSQPGDSLIAEQLEGRRRVLLKDQAQERRQLRSKPFLSSLLLRSPED